ncbi:hypothetical protein C1A_776 [Wolbachia endosymbiont of Culex quinquefasciatus JHB]|nr:hypothetical protein C1A_776 [Wolbachia endosymbiont of Culex quinquefasciatus JHB]
MGKCYDNTECDKCVDALNSSIIMVLATDHNTQAADSNIYFL